VKTLDRYIAAAFLKSFALASFALASLYLFQALLGDLLDGTQSAQQTIIYQLMNLPAIFTQMVPPAAMVATVMTLSGMNRANELTACHSIGVSLGRLVSVMLTLVFMVSCLMLVFQDRVLPPLYRKKTAYYWREIKKKPDFFLDLKQDKIWYRSKNLIYNLRTFDAATKTIHGMSVYTFDEEFNLVELIEAERAAFTERGWRLADGTVTVFSHDESFPLTQSFKEKELLINETPRDFQEIEKEVDGLRLKELHRYIKRTSDAGTDTKAYQVKFHSRISLSFIPLIMCLLGVPFSTRNRREGSLAKDLGLCFGVTFFYWLFYSVSLSLGTNGALPPLLAAWLPSTIFAALAATLIARRYRT
jgi:lipopolysaccharide export system permease protein